jgi:hypothetical protein
MVSAQKCSYRISIKFFCLVEVKGKCLSEVFPVHTEICCTLCHVVSSRESETVDDSYYANGFNVFGTKKLKT